VNNRPDILSVAAAAFVVLFGAAPASAEALRIGWGQLRPASQHGELVAAPLASPSDANGRALSWTLEGKQIELTGYVLPVDREGDLVYEFMLVPWFGACSHTPPPPPNQIVLVTPQNPFKLAEIYQLATVSGTLEPGFEKTQLFIMDGVALIQSGYSIGGAVVAMAESSPATPSRKATPWNFLNK
jgi:uncharacterized protein